MILSKFGNLLKIRISEKRLSILAKLLDIIDEDKCIGANNILASILIVLLLSFC